MLIIIIVIIINTYIAPLPHGAQGHFTDAETGHNTMANEEHSNKYDNLLCGDNNNNSRHSVLFSSS